MIEYVLGYILAQTPIGPEIIMGYQKRGKWKGKLNGFGGKVEPNENTQDAMQREFKEETQLDFSITDILKSHRGDLYFIHRGNHEYDCHVTVYVLETTDVTIEEWKEDWKNSFTAEGDLRIIRENQHMLPASCKPHKIPYIFMPPEDSIWLPRILHKHRSELIPENLYCTLIGNCLHIKGEPTHFEVETVHFGASIGLNGLGHAILTSLPSTFMSVPEIAEIHPNETESTIQHVLTVLHECGHIKSIFDEDDGDLYKK